MRHHGCHLRWYVISAYLFSVLIANGKLTMHIQMSIFSVRERGGGEAKKWLHLRDVMKKQ